MIRDTTHESPVRIKKTAGVGLAVNLALSALKFVLGAAGMSHALIADAFHSLSDMSTDIMVLTGAERWTKPPDACHPYGHRRVEILIAGAIGAILLLTAGAIAFRAFMSLRAVNGPGPRWMAFWGAVLSVITKEAYYRWVKKKQMTRSPALLANAWHHRADALSSIPVALAIAMAVIAPSWWFVDRIGALLVSIFIILAAFRTIRPVIEEFLCESVSQGQLRDIEQAALTVTGVRSAHGLRTRTMGGEVFMDLHILVDGKMTVHEGHIISERVKEKLLTGFDNIADVVVHLEPDGA